MPLSSTCPPRPFRATLIHPLTTPKQRDASGDKGFSIAKQDLCGRFVFWGVDPRAQRSFNGSVLPDFPVLVDLSEPLPDVSRGGVSSFRRLRVAVVLSDIRVDVHSHRSSAFRFLWLPCRMIYGSVKCP